MYYSFYIFLLFIYYKIIIIIINIDIGNYSSKLNGLVNRMGIKDIKSLRFYYFYGKNE